MYKSTVCIQILFTNHDQTKMFKRFPLTKHTLQNASFVLNYISSGVLKVTAMRQLSFS